jgi:hypothetical protein
MRVHGGIIASLMLVSNISLGATFSVEQRKAALTQEQLMQWQSAVVVDCTGHLGEGVDAASPFFSYFWRIDDLKYGMMKDLIWPAMTEVEKATAGVDAKALQSRLASASAAGRVSLCNELVIGLKKPESHLEHRSPEHAKVLDAMFDTHPELRLKWQLENFTAGCVMHNFNAGSRVFKTAKSICDCQTKAIFGQASERELSMWSDDSTRKQVKGTMIQRAMPAILSCQATFGPVGESNPLKKD